MPRPVTFAFRGPVLTYQRHRDAIENTLLAAALTLLVGVFLDATGAYPEQWRMVLLLALFALGAQARAWGYYAAVAILLWPLWSLSPHLMALFLAVALLPRGWIIEGLPWALLIVAAPLLAEWQVVALVPLLAGLLAGPMVGLWAGGLTALWLKLVAGLSGWLPELGDLHGVPFTLAAIEPRIADTTSLEILERLAAPFAQSSSLLLLHLLQIVAWALAGWLVGKIRHLDWRNGEPRFLFAPALAAGTLVLWVALFLIPAWLELKPLAAFLTAPLPTVGLALSAIMAALLTTLYESVQRPVPRRTPRPRPAPSRVGREGVETVRDDSAPPHRPWAEPARPEEDDVIMLELD